MTGHASRVLVTGSRDWDDPGLIRGVLDGFMSAEGRPGGRRLVVVHGAHDFGADAIAARWVAEVSATHRWVSAAPHPVSGAQWSRWGRAAGPRRNREMVDKGADRCLAFIRNDSRGARGCAEMARAAGIDTVVWERSGVSVFTAHGRRVRDSQGRDAWRVEVAERSDNASTIPMGAWLTHAGGPETLRVAANRLRLLVAEKLCIRPGDFDWVVLDRRPREVGYY